MAPVLDSDAVAAVLASAPTVSVAAFRLKTSRQRLRARCVADDVLRPLFYKLADRGSSKRRDGMRHLRFIESGR